MQGETRNQFGDMLRREKLTARFTRIGRIVGNEKLIGVSEQIDFIVFERKPSVDPMAYRMKTEGGAGHGHRREPEIQTRWGFKERGVSASGEADGDSARTRNTSAKYFQGSTPRILHVHTRL